MPSSTKQPSISIYAQLSKRTRRYFGAKSTQHMAKLINTHLNKSPEELTAAELASLLDWIKSMAHFLEEDKVKVENYMAELLNLTHEKRSDSEA